VVVSITTGAAVGDDNLVTRPWAPGWEGVLRRVGEEGRARPGGGAPVATVDWDNTMVLNDVGEATFLYLVETLGFAAGEAFWGLVPEQGRAALREHHRRARGMSPGARPSSPAYRAWCKGMVAAYRERCDREGESVCFPWLAQALAGMSVEEVRAAARAALERETARPVGVEWLRDGDKDPRPVRVDRGIRYLAPMVELVATLAAQGLEVWVVSASAQWVVEEAAARVGIPADRVLGVKTQVDARGRLTTRVTRATWRQGKADAIMREIGRPPFFAAGDSNTDLEMLLLGTGPRLVMDRGKRPLLDVAREKGWFVQPPFLALQER
jgi:phosphoserine phosphatase